MLISIKIYHKYESTKKPKKKICIKFIVKKLNAIKYKILNKLAQLKIS